MTTPARKAPVRRKPVPKPIGEVAAEVVAVETSPLPTVTAGGFEWGPLDAEATPIGYGLARELAGQVS